jgi:NADH-quinone oxidoreductase subunit N
VSAELAFALPLALGLAGALVSLAGDAMESRPVASWAAISGMVLAAVAAGAAVATLEPARVWRVFAAGAGYSTATALIFAFGALSVVASLGSRRLRSGAFPGLVALSASAAAVLAVSTDLIAMLIALEAVALTGYALVSLSSTPAAHEAAMKYFVQGAVATALFVLGLAAALIGGALVVGEGALSSVSSVVDLPAATVGVALLIAAFAFKLGAFPFHAWAPDAYETAPPEAAAFLASGVKLGAFVALFTAVFSVLGADGLSERAIWFIAAIAGASIVYGNLAALSQKNLARMLAYSGIAQVGYGLTAFVVGNGSAALMFAAAYGCAAAGAFAAVAAYGRLDPDWDGSISGLAGLARRAPVLSASFAVLLFSLTGIPPLFGFWGKFLVFLSAASDPAWLWLVVLGLLGSVVSFGYYGRVLRALYFEDAKPADAIGDAGEATEPNGTVGSGAGWAGRVAVALAVVVILAGLVPVIWGFGRFVGTDPPGVFLIVTELR